MSEIDATSDWYHVMAQFLEDKLRELGVALPGNVVTYDRATQTAHVKFAVTERIPAYTGDEILYEDRADVFNVPVIWPSGTQVGTGSSYFHPGLEPGDGVLLICTDSDFAQWRKTGKKMNQRNDVNHSWKNLVALPGLNPKPDRLPDSDVILAVGGVTRSVAVAEPLRVILNTLIAQLNAFASPPLSLVAAVTPAHLAAIGTALQSALTANNINSPYIKTGGL